MLYQMIVAAVLFIFLLNLFLNLRSLKTPRSDSKVPEPAPLVSIMVPARNEETNIEACVQSLRQQDYPNFEILVLDDESVDNTASIVERIAATDKRLRLIKGEPLPLGWAGKPSACYQLAQQARGSWFLFVDADTTHAPHMLRSVLPLAVEMKASLLSGFPRQLATFTPQKIVIPILYFILLACVPLWWVQRSKEPRTSLAIGQFLLFPREEYWRIGGHRAVKGRILEDVWLGVETVRHGGRQVAVDLSPVVSCNMYQSVGALWEGFIKWVYSVAAISPAVLLAFAAVAYFLFLAPFYWLWNELSSTPNTTGFGPILLVQVSTIIFMRWMVDSRFKEPVLSAIAHPFGISFLFLATLYGAGRRALGIGIRWKDRVYDSESCVK